MNQTKYIGETDYSCIKCGYDLRQTPLGGVCPECGLPVKASKARVRIEDDKLIVQDGAILPERCIKTNQPLNLVTKKATLYHVSPWIYLLLLVNLLVLLLVYILVRKKVDVTYSISDSARKKIWLKTGIAWTVAFFSFGCCVVGLAADKDFSGFGALGLLSGLLSLIAICVALSVMNHLTIGKKINKDEYVIKGVCREFIEQIKHDMQL